MLSLSEIIEVVKDKKCLKKDKDVAKLLGIEAKQFATAKSRNSIPYEILTSFCSKEGWSLNWLLSGEGPQYLESKRDLTDEKGAKYHAGAEVVKYVGLLPEEQELIDMLVAILRGENVDNKKAVIENIRAFYKTRNINVPDEVCLKKTTNAE